jgi:hypothetical protein
MFNNVGFGSRSHRGEQRDLAHHHQQRVVVRFSVNKKAESARCRWLTPVILATQEAELRFEVRSQPRQIVLQTLS